MGFWDWLFGKEVREDEIMETTGVNPRKTVELVWSKRSRQWHYRIKAANHEIETTSEPFTRKYSAKVKAKKVAEENGYQYKELPKEQ